MTHFAPPYSGYSANYLYIRRMALMDSMEILRAKLAEMERELKEINEQIEKAKNSETDAAS